MVKKNNILITGSFGQLGTSIKNISDKYDYRYFFTNKDNLNINNFLKVESFLKKFEIDIIINCAAYTNVNMSAVEKKLAENVNIQAVDNLAKLCHENNVKLIHISTDYVFDGEKKTPYNETDLTNPINFYGLTKLRGENSLLSSQLKNSIIIRTSWLYSQFRENFVKKITKKLNQNENIHIVKEEIGSPTNATDLARAILEIIPKLKNEFVEIYHFSNGGFCSRQEFVTKIKELVGSNSKIILKESNNDVHRPKYSALDCTKIQKKFNIANYHWMESLEMHFKNYLN